MSRLIPPILRRARRESGFTLIEVIVAMVAGIIVTGALFAILEVSLHQSSRLTDRVQAQQIASNTLTRILEPLRSACIAREATPVLKESTPSRAIFVTSYSEAHGASGQGSSAQAKELAEETAAPGTGEVYKQTIELNASHKLTAKVQKATGGAWPTFTSWEEPGKTAQLAENVYTPSSKEWPYVFRYYKYGTESSSTSTTGVSSLQALTNTGPLTEAEAKTVAAVEVNLEALPQDNNAQLNRGAESGNRVTFAFSTPNSEGTIKDAPCE